MITGSSSGTSLAIKKKLDRHEIKKLPDNDPRFFLVSIFLRRQEETASYGAEIVFRRQR